MSMYADDTTLFLKADKDTVKKTLDVFHWFKKVLGISINIAKTRIIKIGADRAKKLIREGQFGLEWSTTFVALGINFDVNRVHDITDINIQQKLKAMKNITKTWKCRSLMLYGKVAVIKSLVMSNITHLLLALPCPNQALVKKLESFVADFIWNGKAPRFRKDIIEAEVNEGGMKLILFSKCLSWMRRLESSTGNWINIPREIGIDKCIFFGSKYTEDLYKK